MCTIEELAGILKHGGTVTIDCETWSVDSAHPEIDMPVEVANSNADEFEDDHLERKGEWWDDIRVCDSSDVAHVKLIQALCLLAGVRLRQP